MRKNTQANELPKVANSRQSALQIASWKHFVGFLLIGAGVVALGMLAQRAPAEGGAGTSSGQLAGHSQAIHIYLAAIVMDWLLLYYCWVGVHHGSGSLKTLSGGRWESWKDLAIDVAISVPFFAIWEGAAYCVHRLLWAFGPSSAKTVDNLLPQSLLEILLWIATSITAGICEEIAFRGYVQKQFHALSGNIAIGILGQGLVFGLFHAYQGWKNVIVIRAGSFVRNARRLARKSTGEHNRPCLDRRLGRLVEVRGLEIESLQLLPTVRPMHSCSRRRRVSARRHSRRIERTGRIARNRVA